MPWCPKCKSEYRDGFTVCADCGSMLVEALVEEEENNRPGDRTQMTETAELSEQWEQKLSEQFRNVKEKDSAEESVVPKTAFRTPLYQDSSERANENKSSAWMLLTIGSLGIAVILLSIFGVIPLKFGNAYLGYGVMAAICILFLVAGMVSVKNARIFKKKAESENSLRDTMLEWCRESLHGEELDRQIRVEGNLPETEEIWYFRRFDCIKDKLNYKFVNLDQDFLDRFIDDYVYELVYGSEESEGM